MHTKLIVAATIGVGLLSTACESGLRNPASEVDSQVGADETKQISIQQNSGRYQAVGILAPLGCTGWFVSKKFFITNQHCVSSNKEAEPENGLLQHDPGICAGMTITVNYYRDNVEAPVIYKCKRIHLANQAHDVAIVEIDGEAVVEPLRIGEQAVAGMNVIVVGHPAGRAKTISEIENGGYCALRDVSFPEGKTARDAHILRQRPKYEYSIEHNCDTLGGSSGSPIIDRTTGTVVALHWDGWQSSAWPHADPNGTETATVEIDDPTNPGQKMPFSFKHRQGNVGIRIQDIRSFVQQAAAANPSLAAAAALFQ